MSLPDWGGAEAAAALEAFKLEGNGLELACGPGMWTEQLLRHATSLVAVDASEEMLARARARVGEQASFIRADLFTWRPSIRYDFVFFGFWLSHVPHARFDAFWALVDACLKPDGRVFFVDDAVRTPQELVNGPSSPIIERRVGERAYRALKVPYQPRELEARLATLGWRTTVTQTSGAFYHGAGSHAESGAGSRARTRRTDGRAAGAGILRAAARAQR